MATSRFEGLAEDQLARKFAAAKGWRTRKIKTMEHMIKSVTLKFDLSSYNRLQSEMTVLKKQIVAMQEVAQQLLTILATDRDR